MATHKVNVRVPSSSLGNADICFDVFQDDSKLGTVQVSKGSVEWVPAWKSKTGYRLSWTKFSELMESSGKKVTNIRKKK